MMRQVLALFTAVVFTLGLVGAALAQGTSTGSSTTQSGSSATSPSGAAGSTTDTTKSTAPSGSATGATGMPRSGKMGKTAAGAMRGQHRMVGEVTKIDHEKGMLTLKTDEGDMDLHFPPSALSNIKEGERVEVHMAIRPASAGGTKGPASKSSTGKISGAAKSGSPQTKTP